MARERPDLLITALGLHRDEERFYTQLLAQSGREVVSAADAFGVAAEELLARAQALTGRGLVEVRDGRVFVTEPLDALSGVLAATAGRAHQTGVLLEQLAGALPWLSAAAARPRPGEVHDVAPLDGEVSSGGQVVGLLAALIARAQGDLLWFRPDLWRPPEHDSMLTVLGEFIAGGGASRAVYPVRVLTEAPETVEARLAIGEQIRVVPELTTRLLVLGPTHAILPEPLGLIGEPRSLLRQRGLVEAVSAWFEEVWARATPVPGEGTGLTATQERTILLEQLAGGAQDEQIARRLAISLRTVRRRVAALMSELGAESRFQAGVEAARRGWL